MSVTIKHSRAFWFGPLPKRAKKLRKEWSYIEDGRGFLKAASPDGTLCWIHPRTGLATRCVPRINKCTPTS